MVEILLVDWKSEQAKQLRQELESTGFRVRLLDTKDEQMMAGLKSGPPAAAIIDLRRLPSHGRDVAIWLRQQKATRSMALMFIEGDTEKTDKVKAILPDAFFCASDAVLEAIPKAIASIPAKPIVPNSFAGYSGTPLPKKLGIKSGSKILLLSAPKNIDALLSPLPENVEFCTAHSKSATVVLQFNASEKELETQFPTATSALAKGGRIWLIWPKKSSGVKTDLTQTAVRAFGLQRGFVDFKVAAIDETWSGLCFSRRKSK